MGFLFGLGAVFGLIVYAVRVDPKIPEWKERRRLASLIEKGTGGLGRLKLDEAEDGLVLARRYGDKLWEKRFAAVVKELRKSRAKV